MNPTERRYSFPVRPEHLETLDSYGTRVLEANFETSTHQRIHIRHYQGQHAHSSNHQAWLGVLQHKTERDLTRLTAPPQLLHPDGTQCANCLRGINERHACIDCTHGAHVAQWAHFNGNVCLRHQRWVGPGTDSREQLLGGPDLIGAELAFRKLRRRNRIDATLYLAIRHALTGNTTPDPTDAFVYPALIQLLALLTSVAFSAQLFNPNQTYAQAFAILNDAVRNIVHAEHHAIARRVWLYLRPSFLAVREHLNTGQPFRRTTEHDFPLRNTVVGAFTPPTRPLEPFNRYLAVTDDLAISDTSVLGVLGHREAAPPVSDRTAPVTAVICRNGHRFSAKTAMLLTNVKTGTEDCPYCERREVVPGETSMAMTNPGMAQWFHPTANTPDTPDTVFGHLNQKKAWRCRDGHDFKASPLNMSNPATGGCPTCQGDILVPGVNCLPSKFPAIAAEWHPTRNYKNVDEVAFGSNQTVWWLCSEGHEFRETVANRTRGKNCTTCKTNAFKRLTIAQARQDWATQWHPTRNLPNTPETITVGSSEPIEWVCDSGHNFRQTPELRGRGYGCQSCSRNKVTPGVNDAATRYPETCSEWHPVLNGSVQPCNILPGATKYWWKCKTAGHEYQQSIPNRALSHGCKECSPKDRIGRKK